MYDVVYIIVYIIITSIVIIYLPAVNSSRSIRPFTTSLSVSQTISVVQLDSGISWRNAVALRYMYMYAYARMDIHVYVYVHNVYASNRRAH